MTPWLRLHAQAFADALGRLAAQPIATGVSVLVLGIAMALPVIAAVLLRSLGAATATIDTDPHIDLYLALEATDEDVARIEKALRARAEVASVRFVSRAQALAELKATTHLADLLASLDRNPLPHAFSGRLRPLDAERLKSLRADLARLPRVDQVIADFEWSERVARWVRFGDRVLAGLSLVLGLAVLFTVGHLIRLQVLTHKDEIELSQLIGATAADVRRPFLYHGGLEGLAAAAAALALASGLAFWLEAELRALAPAYASEMKIVFLGAQSLLTILLGGILLGVLGAWIAVERELRAFSKPAP